MINLNNQTRHCTIFVPRQWSARDSSKQDKTMKLKKYIYILSILLSSIWTSSAQEKISEGLEIDKTVHNFGDILLNSGPVSCTFTIKNTGSKAAVIYNVVSSCGCTNVKWTREPIRPGGTGTISATYSNDEGAYPFDKGLTAYFSDVKKPVVLKLRGNSIEELKPLAELYPVHFGAMGLREAEIKCGNMEQGGQKSNAVNVANISDKPVTVTFVDTDKDLEIYVKPNPIPAKSIAELFFTVKADEDKWGKNWYWATPVVNGKRYKDAKGRERIGIWAFTKENFSSMSQDEKAKGARPKFNKSTFEFGVVESGTVVQAEFTFVNEGARDFTVHKVDADAKKWSHSPIKDAKPGEKVTFTVEVDTDGMPEGEALTVVTLTTNSPLRPIVNLFITGWLK